MPATEQILCFAAEITRGYINPVAASVGDRIITKKRPAYGGTTASMMDAESTDEDPRSGRPSASTDEANSAALQSLAEVYIAQGDYCEGNVLSLELLYCFVFLRHKLTPATF